MSDFIIPVSDDIILVRRDDKELLVKCEVWRDYADIQNVAGEGWIFDIGTPYEELDGFWYWLMRKG